MYKPFEPVNRLMTKSGCWWWNTIGPAALQQITRAGGHFRMGRSEKYRHFAQECVEMARTVSSPRTRAVLLHMAQVWFRLAEDHTADAAQQIQD